MEKSRGKYFTFPLTKQVLIIDEISMISPYFFYMVDEIAKDVRKKSMPFGGLQLIVS
jgi:hypothetical protein